MATKNIDSLDKLMMDLQKKHGQESIQFGNTYEGSNVERWTIDSPAISYILGGGLPKGRIVEIYGPESSGKTSLACYLAGEATKQGEKVAYIDVENAADLEYAETLGLNRKNVLFSQPNSGEQALQIAQEIAESGLIKIIIIDSVSALIPEAEIEGEMGDQQMGIQARLMSKGLRKLSHPCSKNGVTIIFINQIRMKIGVMYGNSETTSGGVALKFFSSIRLEVRKVEYISNTNEAPKGLITRIKSVKNKTAPPMRKAEVKILFGKGFQYQEEYIDFAIQYDIIKKAASWFSLLDANGKEIEKIQGKEKVVEYVLDNPEYLDYLKKRVEKAMNLIKEEEDGPKEPNPPKKRKGLKNKIEEQEETIEINENE